MGFIELILVGVGLSMDAAAVSMTNGMVYKESAKSKMWAMPIFFGIFQGLMPLLGYFFCEMFAEFMNQYSNVAVFVILGLIGGKMILDGLKRNKDQEAHCPFLTYRILLFQAIATSIDAFAVGIGFAAIGVSIISAVTIIAITTTICSFIAILIGEKFGDLLGSRAEILGGIILFLIGLKALI